ncbi:hypothetical protein OAD62_01235 [Oceanihabitans sp.]|nr:hypothetical protein [Oceanihabitans sp.]
MGSLATAFVGFVFYLIFIIKIGPVDTRKDKSIQVIGIVDTLYEGGVKDLVFKLKNDSNIYYINRALENGFDLNEMNGDLLGNEVIIWHAKSRRGGGHMMQLKFQDSIYYTEWQNPLASKN